MTARPLSAVPMIAGLVLVGVAGYSLLAVAGWTLDAAGTSAVAVFYLTANIIGPGLATAMEQETSRSVSNEIAMGRTPRIVIRRMVRLAAVAMVLAVVALSVLSPLFVDRGLNGDWGLFAALLLCVPAFGALYLVRGVLGGTERFDAYAVTLAIEGLARLLPIFVLYAAGGISALALGLVFVLGPALAAGVGMRSVIQPARAISQASPGPIGLGRSFAQLLASAVLMQLVANLAPVISALRLPDDPQLVATLAVAFVLARIPLFLFTPVQNLLLPRLVQALARGDVSVARNEIRRTLAVVVLAGGFGIAGMWLAGQWTLTTFMGAKATLPGWVMPLLGVGTVVMMAAQVLQPALLASKRHDQILWAWTGGAVSLCAIAFLPVDPVIAAVMAQVVGPVIVVLVIVRALVETLRSREGTDVAN